MRTASVLLSKIRIEDVASLIDNSSMFSFKQAVAMHAMLCRAPGSYLVNARRRFSRFLHWHIDSSNTALLSPTSRANVVMQLG
jgi:hypothetical protein